MTPKSAHLERLLDLRMIHSLDLDLDRAIPFETSEEHDRSLDEWRRRVIEPQVPARSYGAMYPQHGGQR